MNSGMLWLAWTLADLCYALGQLFNEWGRQLRICQDCGKSTYYTPTCAQSMKRIDAFRKGTGEQ